MLARYLIDSKLCCVMLVVLSLLSMPAAQAVTVKFVDQQGRALANVVAQAASVQGAAEKLQPVMDQIDKQFLPHVLLIRQGQSVTFPNSDDIRHHVYSFSKPKNFEIRLYKGKPAAPIAFNTPGIVVLGCNIHDHMVGFIYISENAATTISDKQGEIRLNTNPKTLKIWHPRLSADNLAHQTIQQKQLIADINPDYYTVTLNLLPEKKPKSKGKFKSRFKHGD